MENEKWKIVNFQIPGSALLNHIGIKVFDNTESSGRLLDFATNRSGLAPRLEHTPAGEQIALQLIRSSISSGANYELACGAEGRADFIRKLQIVLKELRNRSLQLNKGRRKHKLLSYFPLFILHFAFLNLHFTVVEGMKQALPF